MYVLMLEDGFCPLQFVFTFVSLFIRQSVHLPFLHSVHLSICLLVYLPSSSSIPSSVCPPNRQLISLPLRQYMYASVCPSICSFVLPSVCPFARLYFYPSVRLSRIDGRRIVLFFCFIHPSFKPSFRLYVLLSFWPHVLSSVCPPVRMSVPQYVHLSWTDGRTEGRSVFLSCSSVRPSADMSFRPSGRTYLSPPVL